MLDYMRITAGYARGILLGAPKSDATRPATDAARLALFSSVGGAVESARCLDLFAGTGAYGLEAASRGAAEVVLVENNRNAFKILKSNIDAVLKCADAAGIGRAKVEAVCADCLKFGGRLGVGRFDFVFADPPYAMLSDGVFCKKLADLFCEVGSVGTLFMLEAPAEFAFERLGGRRFELVKRLGKTSKGKPSQIIFKIGQ